MRHVFRPRLLEWMNASILLLTGLIMLLTPLSFDRPNYSAFAQHPALWTYGCLSVGLLRIIALIINGNWKGGTPVLRFIGSISGMCVFGVFVGNLINISTPSSIPFGLAAYIGLMIGEAVSSYYTASDIAYVKKYWS